MTKVTFATREFVENELEKFKIGVDEDLGEHRESIRQEQEKLNKKIDDLKDTIDNDVTKRINDVEKKFGARFDEFQTEVEDSLEELSKNILVENIKYKNELHPNINNVKSALDTLLYFDTEAVFNTSTSSINEMGTILNDVVFSWTYNKPTIVAQNIDGTPIAKTSRSYKYPTPISDNKTVRLSYNDGTKEGHVELSFTFLNNVYYGAISDLSDSNILGLTKQLASGKKMTINVNANDNQHIAFALPVRFGTPKFMVGGFEGGFVKDREVSLTNNSGYTETYAIWKSVRAGLGVTTVNII